LKFQYNFFDFSPTCTSLGPDEMGDDDGSLSQKVGIPQMSNEINKSCFLICRYCVCFLLVAIVGSTTTEIAAATVMKKLSAHLSHFAYINF
jgi:hypothetical protein